MKRLVLPVLILTLFGGATVTAQLPDNTIIISGNIALPAGGWDFDFRSNMGFGVVLDYLIPLSDNGFAVVSSTGLLLSKMDVSIYEMYNSEYYEYFGIIDRYEAGYWMDIPLLTGLGFKRQAARHLAAFGAVQFGCDIILAPDIVHSNGEDFLYWDNTIAFGYSMTGGAVIGSHLSFAIRYFDFGIPAFNLSTTASGRLGSPAINQPISFACFQIGYCF